jgi:hypothetical protein
MRAWVDGGGGRMKPRSDWSVTILLGVIAMIVWLMLVIKHEDKQEERLRDLEERTHRKEP